jgi:hypothetical protein
MKVDTSDGCEIMKNLVVQKQLKSCFCGIDMWNMGNGFEYCLEHAHCVTKYGACQCLNREGIPPLTVKTIKKHECRGGGGQRQRKNLGNHLNFVISTVTEHIHCQFRIKTDWLGVTGKAADWGNPKVHYRVQQNSSLVPILSQFNQSHTLITSILAVLFCLCRGVARGVRVAWLPREAESKGRQSEYFKRTKIWFSVL